MPPQRSDEFNFRPQGVNYLGFLEAQLRDLQGPTTLVHELVQNADDARDDAGQPQTSWICFDVTDEALRVENDGAFRDADFARLQNIAGGGKRGEAGTTGAFGLGFIAVYQVTDAPEIFSSGRHWTIHPEAPPAERIVERAAQSTGTVLRLPWAFDASSPVRRALRAPVVRPEQLDDLAQAMAGTLPSAALFLRQLRRLEVRRNGRLLQRISRSPLEGDEFTLMEESGRSTRFLLFTGDFDLAAEQLRSAYPWQIETQRDSRVRLALPVAGQEGPGLLYAGLPTATETLLPFHVDADFFPTTDRHRIHFADGYQAAWNSAAIAGAAAALSTRLDVLRGQLAPAAFWRLLERTAAAYDRAVDGELAAPLARFWEALAPRLAREPFVLAADDSWKRPAAVRLPVGRAALAAFDLLAALGIPLVHQDLLPFAELLRRPEIAAASLSMADVTTALANAGLVRTLPLQEAPPFLRDRAALNKLWDLLDVLLLRQTDSEARDRALAALAPLALVLTDDSRLERLSRTWRGSAEVRLLFSAPDLFPEVAWLAEQVAPQGFPGRFVREFGVRQAVEQLGGVPLDRLEAAWRLGRLDLPGLFRWFESRQIEIFADDPALQRDIRRLPLHPVAGELRPLDDLYLPGGFADPLQLSGLVDVDAIGGRRQFLEDLGVRELDFYAYLRDVLPRAMARPETLPSDRRQELLQLLAQRLGELRDDDELRTQLRALPLVPALDGSFRPGQELYAHRDVLSLLGFGVHVAEPSESAARAALYGWLGVRETPSVEDLVAALLALADLSPGERASEQAERCWAQLAAETDLPSAGARLATLGNRPVVPRPGGEWHRPVDLLFNDAPAIAARFPDLAARLLAADHPAAPALTLAGVAALSAAAHLELVGAVETEPDTALAARVHERWDLVLRVVGTRDNDGAARFLQRLQIRRAASLQLRYRLTADSETIFSVPEPVTAYLQPDGSTLIVVYASETPPYPAVARELARGLTAASGLPGVAGGIKEALAAPTAAAAAMALSELGYT